MKKSMKIMLITIMVLMTVVSVTNVAFAAGDDLMNLDNVGGTSSDLSTKASSIMNSILGVVQVVAVSIAVIMLIILGVKYISAAPAEKADIKKGAMIYVVGAALLFGATGILAVIKNFAGTI